MTLQSLISTLLDADEAEGRRLLTSVVTQLNAEDLAQLVDRIKRAADQQWITDAYLSFVLSGHLMVIGELSEQKSYHALGLMARGDALRRLDRAQEALPFLDAAGEEFLEIDDEVGWARTRIGRVSACLQLNRPTEALRDAAIAHDIFMRYHKYLRAGQIDVNAAIVNYELGNYDQALKLFDRAMETYTLQGEGVDLNMARARGNKAVALAAQGKFREAISLHEKARATFAKTGNQAVSVAREELNIAEIYAAQGHYSQALLLFDRSRTIFQEYNHPFEAAEVAQQICLCLVRLNRTREAYTLAAKTVAFFRTSQAHHPNLAYALMYQAEAALLLGQISDAEAMLQEARDLLEEGGFMALASIVRLQQAELYFANGKIENSLREVRLVADEFAEREVLPQLARASLLQARIATVTGDISAARDLCVQALDIALAQGLLDLKYRCYDLLGQIAEMAEDLDAAISYYDRAIQGIDDVQSRLVMDARTSFLEDKGAIYQRAIILALALGQHDQALIYVEKAKSRVLGDYLRNNIDIRLRAGDKAGEAVLEDLTRLREEQAWFSSIVYDAEHEGNLSDSAVMRVQMVGSARAQQEMQQRERQIEQLLERMQLRLVGDLVARSSPRWTDSIVTSLWPRLEETTVMLEYYMTDQDLYIFQLTRQGIAVHEVPGAVKKLERLYSLWRVNLDLAGQAAGGQNQATFVGLQQNCQGLLKRFFTLLLAPVEAVLYRANHAIIVPYGLLHYLPFHCFFDGNRFMVERLNFSYLPSAALLDICRQRGRWIRRRNLPLENSLVLGLSDGGRLTSAVEEAVTVAKQLGAPCYLDKAATTELVQQAGTRSPIIHIAAHGLFRLDAPNFSYIKLGDQQLSSIEVFNLDFSACSLITLSACETGRAVIGGVDEVIGLGRGFLYAGAASLLPTLWKVDDASSAELMKLFYDGLLKGQGKAAALAAAQRVFLAGARRSGKLLQTHPYFWAAFHLIGDPGLL